MGDVGELFLMLFDIGACCDCAAPGLCAVYTVRACSSVTPSFAGWNPGAGLTVRIRESAGGAIVAEGTTDANGQVTLCVPTSATRYVEVVASSRLAAYGASILTNATARTLTPGPAAGWCCSGAGIWYNAGRCDPATWGPRPALYLTDALGTRTPLGGECGVSWPAVGAPVDRMWLCRFPGPVGGDGLTPTRSIEPGVTAVSYTLESFGGGWRIRRNWAELTTGRHVDPATSPATVTDTAYPEFAVSDGVKCTTGGGLGQSEAAFGPIDCSSFYWSGSLTKTSGALADPLGGTVVISG